MATKCEGCGKFAKVHEVWGPGGPAISGNRMLCEPCKDPQPWPECGAEGCRRPARRRSENPWCNRMVSWDSTLEVDHLDGNKMNNTPENLAACCHACNSWNTKLRNTEGMAQ